MDVLKIVTVCFCTSSFIELINYHLVYKKEEYKYLRENIDQLGIKLKTLEAASEDDIKNAKKYNKKIEKFKG